MKDWKAWVVGVGLAALAGMSWHEESLGQPAQGEAEARVTEVSARGVIEGGIREMVGALKDGGLSAGEKEKRAEGVAGERLDFEVLSRLAVGGIWGKMMEEQREEFVREFRKHVLAICRQATGRYTDQDLEITGEREEARGDRTIATRIIGSTKSDSARRERARIDFRLREREGQWKVIDVSVGGISMAAGFRAQFVAVEKIGGVERMLQLLREKNGAAEERRKEGK